MRAKSSRPSGLGYLRLAAECPAIGRNRSALTLRSVITIQPPRFRYGVRICPEPDYWGGLSGCTYQEGISWGKFVPPDEGGRFAEVLSDATVVWPLLMVGLLERTKAKRTSPI